MILRRMFALLGPEREKSYMAFRRRWRRYVYRRYFPICIAFALLGTFGPYVLFVIYPQTSYWRAWEYFGDNPFRTDVFPGVWYGFEKGHLSRDFAVFYNRSRFTKVSTDEHGFRSVPKCATPPQIIFHGASNIFGSNLDDSETVPWRFQAATGIPVFNGARSVLGFYVWKPGLKQARTIVEIQTDRAIGAESFPWPPVTPIKPFRPMYAQDPGKPLEVWPREFIKRVIAKIERADPKSVWINPNWEIGLTAALKHQNSRLSRGLAVAESVLSKDLPSTSFVRDAVRRVKHLAQFSVYRWSPMLKLHRRAQNMTNDVRHLLGHKLDIQGYPLFRFSRNPGEEKTVADSIKRRSDYWNLFGYKYVFAMIPSKQSVYGRDMGLDIDGYTFDWMNWMHTALAIRGVHTVNTLAAFRENRDKWLFLESDPHVTPVGVDLFVDGLVKYMERQGMLDKARRCPKGEGIVER